VFALRKGDEGDAEENSVIKTSVMKINDQLIIDIAAGTNTMYTKQVCMDNTR